MTDLLQHTNVTKKNPVVMARDFSYRLPDSGALLFYGVSFSLYEGQVFCLAGRNGCGKSTFLGLVSGLLEGGQGQLVVPSSSAGISASLLNPRKGKVADTPLSVQNSNAFSADMAMLLQDADLQIVGSTVEEDLLLSAHLTFGQGQNSLEEAYAVALRLGLGDVWNMPVHHLSYGQKRKLCLGTALLRRPQLLLLDEPFSGLDYPACKELCVILKECAEQGMALLVSTHDLEPFLPFMNQLLLFTKSGEVLCDNPQALCDRLEDAGVRPFKEK